jgi:hypothetical protein
MATVSEIVDGACFRKRLLSQEVIHGRGSPCRKMVMPTEILDASRNDEGLVVNLTQYAQYRKETTPLLKVAGGGSPTTRGSRAPESQADHEINRVL